MLLLLVVLLSTESLIFFWNIVTLLGLFGFNIICIFILMAGKVYCDYYKTEGQKSIWLDQRANAVTDRMTEIHLNVHQGSELMARDWVM